MEAGGKDCEEETLQTAFKKLRVDAERLTGAASVSEAPRVAPRSCLDASGAKPKLCCPKDNWHGCMRKTSPRGVSRTQRRRRSKSPILHPPKFTYCSTTAAPPLSTPSGCLTHQRLVVPESVELHPAVDGRPASAVASPAQRDLSSPGAISPLVFGSCAGYESRIKPLAAGTPSTGQNEGSSADVSKESDPRESACDGAETRAPRISGPVEAADFRALSELHSGGSADGPNVPNVPCSCAKQEPECRCRCPSDHQGWSGVEVYSFTGLRNVLSECERSLPGHGDTPRTNAAATASSPPSLALGSPRSCSEQARAYVDDITIEDLSGYMEYYLYIPKKMSHMAEMMYT